MFHAIFSTKKSNSSFFPKYQSQILNYQILRICRVLCYSIKKYRKSIDRYPSFAKSNRFASVSIDTYDRDFRMIERPLSAELEDFRFMSDWNPYFFVGTIALYSI